MPSNIISLTVMDAVEAAVPTTVIEDVLDGTDSKINNTKLDALVQEVAILQEDFEQREELLQNLHQAPSAIYDLQYDVDSLQTELGAHESYMNYLSLEITAVKELTSLTAVECLVSSSLGGPTSEYDPKYYLSFTNNGTSLFSGIQFYIANANNPSYYVPVQTITGASSLGDCYELVSESEPDYKLRITSSAVPALTSIEVSTGESGTNFKPIMTESEVSCLTWLINNASKLHNLL